MRRAQGLTIQPAPRPRTPQSALAPPLWARRRTLTDECRLCRAGDTIIDARKRFWVVDSRGLVVRGRGDADSLPDQARTPSGVAQPRPGFRGLRRRDPADRHPW
jgi:hypothetical protein